jgi:hypothetical protein
MLNNEPIPMKNEVKYLGLHLDRRLTWKTHIKAKKQQLNIKTEQMNWLIGRKSQLSLENKTTNLQSHTKTHMDIWDRTVGMCQAIKY